VVDDHSVHTNTGRFVPFSSISRCTALTLAIFGLLPWRVEEVGLRGLSN
jgi:hypothetical protein